MQLGQSMYNQAGGAATAGGGGTGDTPKAFGSDRGAALKRGSKVIVCNY